MVVDDEAPPRPAVARDDRSAHAAFPSAPPGPPWSWRRLATWALLLAAGGLYLSRRTAGVNAFDSVWAEDGANFLNDAANNTIVEALTRPVNGYFLLYPRLLAEVTTRFPVDLWAFVNELLAMGSTLALAGIVYQASAGHLRRPVVRFLVAAPVVLQWVANGEAVNNVATLQFAMLYTLFWVLVSVPASRAGRVLAPAFAALVSLSTVLALALVPLAVARAASRRDRAGIAMLAALLVGVAVQIIPYATGLTGRHGIGETKPDPGWVLTRFVDLQVPAAFLGEKITPTLPDSPRLVVLVWAGVVLVVAVGFWRRLEPAWVLAALAIGNALAIFAAEAVAMGSVPDRYLVAPMLLLVSTVVAVLRPRAAPPGPRPRVVAFAPVAVFAALMMVVAFANYRVEYPRRTLWVKSWTAQVSAGAAQCRAEPARRTVVVLSGKYYMPYARVTIPCRRLR